MALGGVIAHWRSRPALEPTFQSSSGHLAVSCFCYLFLSSFVSAFLPFGLGFLVPRGYVRRLGFRHIGFPGFAAIAV